MNGPAFPAAGLGVAVSRETRARLETYVDLLARWQRSQNLVALAQVWSRHVADSLQASEALPDARDWVDLGSGAGFPGLVTAIVLAERGAGCVHLVESNRGKAAFLQAVLRETGGRGVVHSERIESFTQHFDAPVDAVSARALAPLTDLLRLAAPLMRRGAVAVFHKGQDFASEVSVATQSWSLNLIERVSRVDPAGRLLVITRAEPRGAEPAAAADGPKVLSEPRRS
jgi:16S rRNA (guanine527-N7)-methyltransferase